MFFTPFTRWMWTDLSSIRDEYVSGNNGHPIEHPEWQGKYARFRVTASAMPAGRMFNRILVAHEGDWTTSEGMSCHGEYKHYEDVQDDLGQGLVLRKKGFSKINKRSLFLFDLDNTCPEHILAVPATGEEICFEIYGVAQSGELVLLVEREL